MSAKKAIKISIQYDDGTIRKSNISDLSEEMKKELGNIMLISGTGNEALEEKKYVLLEWMDGWKEVYAVPADVTDMRRYYLIERTETVGRLFLDRTDGYPELITILRKPNEIKKVCLT